MKEVDVILDLIQKYQEIDKRMMTVKFLLEQAEVEWYRWTEGDLQNVRVTKGSRMSLIPESIERYKKELVRLEIDKQKIEEYIKRFDDLDSMILRRVYIEGLKLYEVAEETGYTYDYIRQRHAYLKRTLRYMEVLDDESLP